MENLYATLSSVKSSRHHGHKHIHIYIIYTTNNPPIHQSIIRQAQIYPVHISKLQIYPISLDIYYEFTRALYTWPIHIIWVITSGLSSFLRKSRLLDHQAGWNFPSRSSPSSRLSQPPNPGKLGLGRSTGKSSLLICANLNYQEKYAKNWSFQVNA